MGDLSEKKIGNEYFITWRDFERGDKKLDENNLNPEGDDIEMSQIPEEEKLNDSTGHRSMSYAERRAGSLRKKLFLKLC